MELAGFRKASQSYSGVRLKVVELSLGEVTDLESMALVLKGNIFCLGNFLESFLIRSLIELARFAGSGWVLSISPKPSAFLPPAKILNVSAIPTGFMP